MCATSANTLINNERYEFSGEEGNGYFDSFSFTGISISRIHARVNTALEIYKAREKTFLSMHICLKGSVEYSVEQAIDPYHVNALEMKIISSELSGTKSKLFSNKETAEISIFFDEDAYKKLIQTSALPIDVSSALNVNLSVCDIEPVYKNLLQLINFPHPSNPLDLLTLKGYCYAIVGEILGRLIQKNAVAAPIKLGSAERVKSFIDSDVKSNKTTRQLATISGTNECYLKKEFKALTGCSIADYRQKQRIKIAQHLLRRGLQNIDAVATEVGYQSADHFVRVFRRHTGIHPKDYNFSGFGEHQNN